MGLTPTSVIFLLMILVIKVEAHLQQVERSSQMTDVQIPQFGGQNKDTLEANNLVFRDYNTLPGQDLTGLLNPIPHPNTLVSDIKIPSSRKFEGQFLADGQSSPKICRSSKTTRGQQCFGHLTWSSPYSQPMVQKKNLAALARNGRLSSLQSFHSRFSKNSQVILGTKQLVDGLPPQNNNPEQIEYPIQDDDELEDCVTDYQEAGEQNSLEKEKRNIRALARAGKLPMRWHGQPNWLKLQKDDFVYPFRHMFQLTPLSFFIDKRQPIGYLRFYKVKTKRCKRSTPAGESR
ncbi:uncharacterized protein LOC111086442 [Limulus polyphemus]|uniref:Uncharacterized protein LOC111086442 n=1 Tax=Limulus polyphemus TaxID=6850 RepID=A0ABM1SN14_LIMPO|nr:uncharacterized protein LOC111086442 [Limulus polyphemus]